MIRIAYPAPDAEIHEDSTFLLGSTEPGAALTVNGEPVALSARGHFCHRVRLLEGANDFVLIQSAPTEVQVQIRLQHPPPPALPAPGAPLAIEPESVRPQAETALLPGDWLEVAAFANPDARVFVHIPDLLEAPVPLPPPPESGWVDNRQGVFAQMHQMTPRIPAAGYHRGRIRIPLHAPPASGLPVELEIRREGDRLAWKTPGRLSIWEGPKTAMVRTDRAVMRTAPQTGARLTPQRAGTLLAVDGLMDGWARVRLSSLETAYIAAADLEILDAAAPAEPGFLEMIHTRGEGPDGVVISLTAGEQRPLSVWADPVMPARLYARFYGTVSRCDFVHYDPADRLVRAVSWRQAAAETVDVQVDLHQPLAGFEVSPAPDGWQLALRALPDRPQAVTILIDPGHGGEEPGASGPDGLPEKSLNLQVASRLQAALAQAGFRVAMTRSGDDTVPLSARSAQVESLRPHIVLSLHHNALPDGRDPARHQGASTYYYHPFARPLAQKLLSAMDGAGTGNYGLLYDSLHMTRIHLALSVLLEIGFFTAPQEYDRLIDPVFQQEVADALARALVDYCREAGTPAG